MPYSFNPTQKTHLKEFIDVEINHRASLERTKEKIESRLMMAKFEEMGLPITITNYGGSTETCKSLIEKGQTPARLQTTIDDIDRGIRNSILKEKFYRYAFNGNLEKCRKYHKIITERWTDINEEIREKSEEGIDVLVSIDQTVNKKDIEMGQNENGYMIHCAEMKKSYEERERMIKYISTGSPE